MIKQITRDELVKMKESGMKFKLVDVLPAESFAKEHIPGAVSIPLAEIDKSASKMLKKNEKIIVYCASFECQASTNAAKKLIELGYEDVLDYKGGLKDYKEGGLVLAGSKQEDACGCD